MAATVVSLPEGRSDRLIPSWSQACLMASRAAASGCTPLAIVAAPRISARAMDQLIGFATTFAPEVAAGVVDLEGRQRFRGAPLQGLDADPEGGAGAPAGPSSPVDLFSDLNQWMLKVLLAPELPESLLSAPRGRYRNATQLAQAAGVSVMSAFRLLQLLGQQGYLREQARDLELVRRDALFERWQAWHAVRPVRERPMRFLLRGDPPRDLARALADADGCLGLFAAADALGVGVVHGVPPHLYVRRLTPQAMTAWPTLVPAERGETPDVLVREAPARQAVFRGMVHGDALPATDVLQLWLDVAHHPARGSEQAAALRTTVLRGVLGG